MNNTRVKFILEAGVSVSSGLLNLSSGKNRRKLPPVSCVGGAGLCLQHPLRNPAWKVEIGQGWLPAPPSVLPSRTLKYVMPWIIFGSRNLKLSLQAPHYG